MTVSVLFLVGRFLFAVPFVVLGVERALARRANPGDRVWAVLGVAGAAGIVLGAWGDLAALLTGLAVLGEGIAAEGAAVRPDDPTRFRMIGLLGAAVCVAAVYAAVGSALDLTLTGPVLDLDLR
jgi:hypothetical protein